MAKPNTKKPEDKVVPPAEAAEIAEALMVEPKDEAEIAEALMVEPKKVAVKESPVKKVEELKDDSRIKLRSTVKNLRYVAKRGDIEVFWKEKGDVDTLTFKQFKDMRGDYPKFLDKPWLIIEDERVLNLYPSYKALYAQFAAVETLDWLNGNLAVVKEKLDEVPETMYGELLTRATGMIVSGELDSVGVIKLLEVKLNTKLLNLIV